MGEHGGHSSGSYTPQHLHQSIWYGWTSRWSNFQSNHLAEITDIRSKLVQNLVKVGVTCHHFCTQLLNPTPDELTNFVTNCERHFDSHLDQIFHLDDLLARDARHHIQMGYPVINYPRYVPTMVELCRSSFENIMDKLKADLAYFKDDFRNWEMFKAIPKPIGTKPHPRPGLGASTPNSWMHQQEVLDQPHLEGTPHLANRLQETS